MVRGGSTKDHKRIEIEKSLRKYIASQERPHGRSKQGAAKRSERTGAPAFISVPGWRALGFSNLN